MDTELITRFLDTIRAAEKESEARYSAVDSEMAYDQWLFFDKPFLQGFYLLVLVFLWHQVEKDLILLAARADQNISTEMEAEDFKGEVLRLAREKRPWKEIRERLPVENSAMYSVCYDVLRRLVNSYKHHPFGKPQEDLLARLKLDTSVQYGPLADSDAVRKALCIELRLPGDEDYSGVADAFIRSCCQFLADTEANARLRPVKRRRASFLPSDAER